MDTVANSVRIIPAIAVPEGAGVTVHRTIGTPVLREYDPFLLLDHISSDKPEDYLAGFPSHPHRGFSTFTYMIDGHMEHQDSMGNRGDLGPGSAQWMKAASGVIHSEMPKQKNGLMRGFQLWINLSAAHKMDQPEYQEYSAEAFPVIRTEDYALKVLIGRFSNTAAPIVDDLTNVCYYDVQVNPGRHFRHRIPAGHHGVIYVFEGSGQLDRQRLPQHSLAIVDADNGELDVVAGQQGVRMLVISGKPLHEAVVRYGPFVMNTREQIDQAMRDFQSNNFVRDRAWIKRSE
ncbi:pirin family protein [Nitrosomonas sp. JL21]|uniref:pirin family protein n=1 Tax=Nitrosomonas sp. JL21 TaxID=153949 RepID=UPI001368FBD1|nr:pirin family protein [Nitrosomonas sp. JL21]MBL8497853.1 pirin family protein [Nitrosomonas sp.]MXS76800.1 pirin family protein [Nitrosomonas sp. JL21]